MNVTFPDVVPVERVNYKYFAPTLIRLQTNFRWIYEITMIF